MPPSHRPRTPGAPDLPRGSAAPPVRIGIHGSPHLAARIVTAAGLPPEAVQFVPYDVTEPFRPLRDRAADLMIVKYDPREPDIEVGAPVALDGRAVVVGAHHPLAGRPSVSVEEVAPYEGFRCPGDFPPLVWDQVVPERTPGGRTIRRVHPMTTLAAMAELLRTSTAMHLSFRSLAAILPPDIAVVPVDDLEPSPVALAWLRDAEQPPHVSRFVAAAERGAAR
ncbi:LysR family transcriptional regulator substrate-binding protein [Streptomyces sp. NPDC058486]|uniref:LysR family transcriptional regulator substrate-binding protein n=1 Tax=unclassified Streptomyces TaxID=2593676 RepID=UPI003664EA49